MESIVQKFKLIFTLKRLLVVNLFLLSITPMIYDQSSYYRNQVPKYIYFSALLIFISIFIFFKRHTIQLVRYSWLTIAFLLFLAVLVLIQFTAYDRVMSLHSTFERMGGGWYYISLLLLYFIYSIQPIQYLDWNRIFAFWVGIAVIITLNGLLFEIDNGTIYRISSTMGNSSSLAHYIVGSLTLLLLLITKESFQKYKFLFITAGIIFLLGLFYTFSRTTIIGLFLSVFVFFLCLQNFSILSSVATRKQVRLLVTLLLVAGVALAYFNFDNLSYLARNTTTLFDRFRLWKITWAGIQERPLLGWGIDNFVYIYDKYHSYVHGTRIYWYDRSHNVFLEWFVNGGIVAGIAFLFIWITLLRSIWQTTLLRSQKALLTSWWVSAVFFLFLNIDVLTNWILLILLCLFVQDNLPKSKVKYLTGRRTIEAISFLPIVIGVLIVTQSFIGTTHAYYLARNFAVSDDPQEKLNIVRELEKREYPSNYSILNKVADYTYIVQTSDLTQEFVNEYRNVVTRMIDAEIERRPPSIYLLFNKANFESIVFREDDAIETYQEIIKVNSHFVPAYVRIGYLYFEQKKYQESLRYFSKANKILPGTAEADLMEIKVRFLLNKKYDFIKDLNKIPPIKLSKYPHIVTSIFKEADRMEDYLFWIWKGGYSTESPLKPNVLYFWAMSAYEEKNWSSLTDALRVYSANFKCSPEFSREVLALAKQGIDPSTKLLEFKKYCSDLTNAD